MYLSRIQIDSKNRQKIRSLSHLGAYHDWVEQSFPQELTSGIRKRHLWRLDPLNGHQYLILLSEDKPDAKLLMRYGIEETVESRDYDPLLTRLKNGQILRFRITANPTHVVPQEGTARGKVFPHVTISQQRQWLVKMAEKSGFEILKREEAIQTENDDQLLFDVVKRDRPVLMRKGGRSVHLSRVTFEGILTVTDVLKFKAMLTHGLGREKAYGMGLMTVIPEG